MKKIDLSLCEFSSKIPLGPEGNLDDSKNGEYGYKVFYDVPKSEIDKLGVFKVEDEESEYTGGEIEFTVDENGEQCGEILVWCSREDEDSVENIDFVNYYNSILLLVEDFNNRENEKGDR